MANNVPCNKQPIQFINCCKVMDCIDIKSTNNSINVEKSECGVDLTFTSNNLDAVLSLNDGDCITFIKEFIDGKLHITPQVDFACIAAEVCGLCPPPPTPVTCPQPFTLSVVLV
jgi:hypothetical protein